MFRVHAAGVDLGVWHRVTRLPYLVRLGYRLQKPDGAIVKDHPDQA